MKRILVFCCLLLSATAYTQQIVTGWVRDKETGARLNTAYVQCKGWKIVTAADSNGMFSLIVPPQCRMLTFYCEGFETTEMLVPDSGKLVTAVLRREIKTHNNANAVYAQRTITGRVVDAKTGKSLKNTSIACKGTGVSVAAKAKGMFSITVPSRCSVLVFARAGYITRELLLRDSSMYITASLQQSFRTEDNTTVTHTRRVVPAAMFGRVAGMYSK